MIELKRTSDNGSAPPHDCLIHALSTIGELSSEDENAIRALPGRLREMEPYEDIVGEGDKPKFVSILVDGFAARYKLLQSGRRQIVSFNIAGDALDVQSLYIEAMDHHVCTLGVSTILMIPHEALLDLFDRRPSVAATVWRSTLIDASVFREWVTNVGRRDAYQRMAHLLCEVMTRMKAIGLVEGQTCQLPLTQAELGDATGLSTVHVNRTLQLLRSDKLIRFRAGSLTILNWEGLRRAGQFDGGYLHLRANLG
jgi:CRP-like cAMP-binding protein